MQGTLVSRLFRRSFAIYFSRFSVSHSLIDLYPPWEGPRAAPEDELASDFLEQATVSDSTVLYRAQVAVESGSKLLQKEGVVLKKLFRSGQGRKKGDVEFSKLKPRRILEFRVKRPEDKDNVYVRGVLALDDKVIIVDRDNYRLKLFDHTGAYLSATEIGEYTYGITRVHKDSFATCGLGSKVFLLTLRGDKIIGDDKTYAVDHDAHGIHYNGTYYCVLHQASNAVTGLDRRRVRKIAMKEAFEKRIRFRWDIHMNGENHDIYVSCGPGNSGILCMSMKGVALWFTLLPGAALFGIMEINDALAPNSIFTRYPKQDNTWGN